MKPAQVKPTISVDSARNARAGRNEGGIMLTDAQPRNRNRAGFLESDRIKTLDLPLNADLQEIAQRLESAMKADKIRDVRSACTEFLATASDLYEVPTCGVRVLAARPLRTRRGEAFPADERPATNVLIVELSCAPITRNSATSAMLFSARPVWAFGLEPIYLEAKRGPQHGRPDAGRVSALRHSREYSLRQGRAGASKRGDLEPGVTTALLTAIGETVIGIAIGTATGS